MRRILIIAVVIIVFAIGAWVLWLAVGQPPLRLVAKYGLPPAGGPTGRAKMIEGVTFLELGPGYFLMGSHNGCDMGDLLGRLSSLVRLPFGRVPKHGGCECPPHWVEIPRSFWLASTPVTYAQYARFAPEELGWLRFLHETPEHSVSLVRGAEIDRYYSWLTEHGDLKVRLPSEAEWEYACRSGRIDACTCDGLETGVWITWDDDPLVRFIPTATGTSGETSAGPLPAWSRGPNAWGFYGMTGTSWEPCQDLWHDNFWFAPADGSAWTDRPAPPDRQEFRCGCHRRSAATCPWPVRAAGAAGAGSSGVLRPATDSR